MFSKSFLDGVAERAVKTFAQTLLAVLTLSSQPVDVFHANWVSALSVALGAGLLSVLTSVVSLTPVMTQPSGQNPPPPAAAPVPPPAAAGPSVLELQAAIRALDRVGAEPVAPPAAAVPAAPEPAGQPAASPPA